MALELLSDTGDRVLIPDEVDEAMVPGLIAQQSGRKPGFAEIFANALASPQLQQYMVPQEPATTLPEIPTSSVATLGAQQVGQLHQTIQQDNMYRAEQKIKQRMQIAQEMEAEKDRQQKLSLEMLKMKNAEAEARLKAQQQMQMEQMRQENAMERARFAEEGRNQRAQAALDARMNEPIRVAPGQRLIDPQTGQVLYSAPLTPSQLGAGRSGTRSSMPLGSNIKPIAGSSPRDWLDLGYGILMQDQDTGEMFVMQVNPESDLDTAQQVLINQDSILSKLNAVMLEHNQVLSDLEAEKKGLKDPVKIANLEARAEMLANEAKQKEFMFKAYTQLQQMPEASTQATPQPASQSAPGQAQSAPQQPTSVPTRGFTPQKQPSPTPNKSVPRNTYLKFSFPDGDVWGYTPDGVTVIEGRPPTEGR